MIPTIGLMIGAYIGLRCFDIFARPSSSFASRNAQIFMEVIAVLVFLVNSLCVFGLIISPGTSGLGGSLR